MRYASLMKLIALAAGMAMPAGFLRDRERDPSAMPKNSTRAGKHGRSVATDRRRAKKARNVARNRAAHR